jgi:Acetyltransferase (GNAT) domain
LTSSDTSADSWTDTLDASPHATVFSDPRYVRAMSKVSGLSVESTLEEGVSAGLIVSSRKRGPLNEVVLPLFTPFSGLMVPEQADADTHAKSDALAALAATIESRFDRIRLHLPPSLKDARPLQWRGWNVSPLYTYRIPVSSGLAGWSSGSRRTSRKGADQFQTAADPAAAGDVIRLMLGSYKRQGRPAPCGADALSEACLTLQREGMADSVVARNASGEAEAGIVLLHGKDTTYYWLAGSLPGPAMTVLLSFVTQFLSDRGTVWLDLVGANTPTIAEFKRRFGPELLPYWAATFERGMLARGISSARLLLGR